MNVAVYVAGDPGVVMMCLASPPSDQESNARVLCRLFWIGAKTSSSYPSHEASVSGALMVAPLTSSLRPVGSVLNVTSTVLGSSFCVTVRESSFESVAVSLISR